MTDIVMLLTSLSLPINFICHLTVFIGGLYIAVHSRVIPTWLSTCLWYIACSSFLIMISMILGWIYGPQFPLSYQNLGFFGEILFNFWIAGTTLLFFLHTLRIDIIHSKHRKK